MPSGGYRNSSTVKSIGLKLAVAHVFNPRILRQRQADLYSVKANLNYILSSRTARSM